MFTHAQRIEIFSVNCIVSNAAIKETAKHTTHMLLNTPKLLALVTFAVSLEKRAPAIMHVQIVALTQHKTDLALNSYGKSYGYQSFQLVSLHIKSE